MTPNIRRMSSLGKSQRLDRPTTQVEIGPIRLQIKEVLAVIPWSPLRRIYKYWPMLPLPPKIGHLYDLEMVFNEE